jgi:hypothetical protein
MPHKPPSTEVTGRVVRFEPRRPHPPRSRSPVPTSPAKGLGKYAQPGDDRDEYRHRMKTNAATVVVVALLIWCGLWLADTIAQFRKNQDCVLSGRSNCAPITVPEQTR